MAPPFAGGLIVPSPGGDTYIGLFEANQSYQVLIEATDAAGNTRQEDFFVNVSQDPMATPNLACNDDINITLDDNCQAEIIPSMVLVGEFGCLVPSDFDITVVDEDPSNGTTVDGCGEFPVNVTTGYTTRCNWIYWTICSTKLDCTGRKQRIC